MELNRKTLLISSGIAILLIGIIIALVIYLKPAPSPVVVESLQSKINDLISGKTAINNLNVLYSLVVNNNNPNDAFTLKLINNSDTNVITFRMTDKVTNTYGVQSAPANLPLASNLPNQLVLSQPVSLAADQQVVTPSPNKVGTLGYMQQQLNNIITGQLPLNNLKVNGSLTVISGSDYPINLNNGGPSYSASAIAFVKNDTITGYLGISGDSPYGSYKVNTAFSNGAATPSSACTSYTSPTPSPTISASPSPTLESLNLILNNIINGSIPIPNLTVNGDITVTGNSDSLFTMTIPGCKATNLIRFNAYTDAFGVDGGGTGWGNNLQGFFNGGGSGTQIRT